MLTRNTLTPSFDTQHEFDFSPLLLADRLLTLAQEADRAGLAHTAGRLVRLAHDVFDEPAATTH